VPLSSNELPGRHEYLTLSDVRRAKRADTEAPIADLIADRFSPRAFAQSDVGESDLRSLLTAASWAPSAGNGQPWRFIVGTRPNPTWHKIERALDEANRRWARFAPVLMLATAQVRRDGTEMLTGRYDLGQAVATLTVQASVLGLHVHQMAGFDAPQVRRSFAIPTDFAPVTAVAIGHLCHPSQLDADLRDRETAPRERRPLSETVFAESFGCPVSWARDATTTT